MDKHKRKLFFLLTLAFIFTVVVGTLSHEFGHYLVAIAQGYDAKICYGMTLRHDKQYGAFVDSTMEVHLKELQENSDYPGRDVVERVRYRYAQDSFLFTLGGPLETMLSATIALVFLFRLRSLQIIGNSLTGRQWLLTCIALFWLRQPVNLLIYLFQPLTAQYRYRIADEIRLAYYFGVPMFTISILTAIAGCAAFFLLVFSIIPVAQRRIFLAACACGGSIGYVLWLHLVGPILMPEHW